MRPVTGLLVLISVSLGQWVETTIPLPDSISGLRSVGAIQFRSANHAMYVGGDGRLIVVDAATREKLAGVGLPGWVDMMCSSTASNKLYCASRGGQSVYVVDCATNHYVRAVRLSGDPREMCYVAAEDKVYFAIPSSNSVQVLDCASDSIVATLDSLPSASDVCYNPVLNRVYSAQSASDEVAVLDCVADTLIRTIWVRGVEPTGLCYDSATNCVYTANNTSATSSVIDCAGDSVVRIVAVGDKPWDLLAGPEGKMFCSGDGPTLTVIDGSETRTIPVGYLYRWSYDPVNRKIYHASWNANDLAVLDAVGESVLVRVALGEGTGSLCYDPDGNSTWSGGDERANVGVIDGATNQVTQTLWCGIFRPGVLRYNPVNHHMYCLEEGWNSPNNHLVVIDGDSNRVLRILPAGGSCDSMLWNPVNNKLYISNSGDNTVSIVDCTSDSIVATLNSRSDWPNGSCCSDGGKVYVCNDGGGVTVIDPVGDSVRKLIDVGRNPWGICYDRTDNKVYVGTWNGDPVRVIDVNTDSVVDSIAVGFPYQSVSWNKSHNKVYVSSFDDRHVAVIDCVADTVLKVMAIASSGLGQAYCDSMNDKVYFADAGNATLRILDPATDSLYKALDAGAVGAMVDNGRPGSVHRLFSTGYPANSVAALSGTGDSVLYLVRVGEEPSVLAWNPVHSWVYVSNYASSSITVLRDTLPVGVEDAQPQASSHKLQATVVRGVLFVTEDEGPGTKNELLDVSGRKVLDLRPGANDVRALAPGVYFIRDEGRGAEDVGRTRKVVIQR
jgi:YVTN family beta-propeller protein